MTLEELAAKTGYDLAGAKAAGVPEQEIVQFLSSVTEAAPETGPTPGQMFRETVGPTVRAVTRGATALNALVGDVPFQLAGQGRRSSESVERALESAGFPAPQDPAARVAEDIASAMTGTSTIAGLARVAQPMTEMGRRIAEALYSRLGLQQTAVAGGAAAAGTVRESGGSPLEQVAAGVGTSLAPAVVAAPVARGLQAVTARRAGPVYREFQAAGAAPTVGQAMDFEFLQGMENLIAKFPGGKGTLRHFFKKQQEDIGAFTQTGVSGEAAGRAIQSGIEGQKSLTRPPQGGFLQRTAEQWQNLDSQLSKLINPQADIVPSNTMQTLQKLTGRVNEPAINEVLQNPTVARMLEAVQTAAPGTPAGPGRLSYQTLAEMRENIGQRLERSALTETLGKGELKALYRALSEDIRGIVQGYGKRAENLYNHRQNLWEGRQDRVEKILEKVAGPGKTPEDSWQAFVPKNSEEVARVRGVMRSLQPDERQIVSEAMIARMGRAPTGKQDPTGEKFSTENFLSNWVSMSDGAKQILFTDPGTRNYLNSVAGVSGRLREAGKVGSRLAESAAAAPYGLAILALMQHFALATLAPLTAFQGAKLLTNQNFVKWLSGMEGVQPSAIPGRMVRLSQIYQQSRDPETREALSAYVKGLNEAQGEP